MPVFEYKQTRQYYRKAGTGPSVILLHGFAEDGTLWNQQFTFLQQHFSVIVPDLPGSGKSELLPDATSMEDYADAVKALADHLQLEQFVLLGHSMGGYITLAFAEKYAKSLMAFGLVHSTAFADNPEKKAIRARGIDLINSYGTLPFIKNTTPNLFTDEFRQAQPEVLKRFINIGAACGKTALTQYYTAMMNREEKLHVLHESTVPVLFVAGSNDTAAPLNDLLQQVPLPKLAVYYNVEAMKHKSMLETPGLVNNFLFRFIELSVKLNSKPTA